MYKCPVCKELIDLTDTQHDQIAEGNEINIVCHCGTLNIIVGADEQLDFKGNKYYEVYSYKKEE